MQTADDAKTEATDDWTTDGFIHKKHFDLLRHLGAQYWPPDIFAIVIDLPAGECGADITYGYIMPDIGLDVALLDNPSDHAIRIRDVIGVLDKDRALRLPPRPEALRQKASRLGAAELVVAPHERLIIPLRAFATAGVDPDTWGSMDTARKAYQKIRAERASAFTLSVRESETSPLTYRIVKEKSAFGPPEVPRKVEYSFGPQLFLSGFVVESENVSAVADLPNVLSLVSSTSADNPDNPEPADFVLKVHETIVTGPSCPILYSWNEEHREWVKHGKVIHTARGAENETTTITQVATDVRQIRLTEEEPEVSFIRAVQLILTLRDGRQIRIDPVAGPIEHAAPWLKLPAYRKLDFRFDVPAEYESAGIVRAEIAVTGYYERYNPLLLSRLLASPGPTR
jgi:hypothetical protein